MNNNIDTNNLSYRNYSIYNNNNNNNNNIHRSSISSIGNLDDNKNLKHFVHTRKFNFDKYKKTQIYFYRVEEEYTESIDSISDVLESNPLEILEINILKNFIYTLLKNNIKRSSFKDQTNPIDLIFSPFKETSNNMNKLILNSKLDSYFDYFNKYLKLKKNINHSKRIQDEQKKINKQLNNLTSLKNQLSSEKKEYLSMKIKKNKLNKIKKMIEDKKKISSNSKEIIELYNKLDNLRKTQYEKYIELYSTNYINLSKKINNLEKNIMLNTNKIESFKNKLTTLKQNGGDFGISIAFLGTFITSILILFIKFKIIYTLFIICISTIPCFSKLSWTQLLSRFTVSLITDLFVLFLYIITLGLAGPFLFAISGFIAPFINFLIELMIKTGVNKTLNKTKSNKKYEEVLNKEVNDLTTSFTQMKDPKLGTDVKETLKQIKNTSTSIVYTVFLDEKMCKDMSSNNILIKQEYKEEYKFNNKDLNLSDYSYNMKADKTIIRKDGSDFYKLYIIDIIRNKKIGYILIDKNLANNFYSLEKVEQNKIKQDYIKIGESEKSKKTFNKFLQKYSSNPEIKKFFYDFYFNLQNYKKPKSSWSFFKK